MTLSPRELILEQINDPRTPPWRKERLLELLDTTNIQGEVKTRLDIKPFDDDATVEEKVLNSLNKDNAEIIKQNQNVIVKNGDRLEVKGNLQLEDNDIVVPATEENLNKVITQDETTTVEEEVKETPADLRRKRLKKYGEKIQGGVLRYPAEALTEHTDYLQIDIERYEAIGSNYITSTGSSGRYVIGTAKQNRAGGTTSKKLSKKPLINAGTILLPIPSNIEDSNNVVYGDSSLNGLAAAGVSSVEAGMVGLGAFLGSGGTNKIDFTELKDNISNRLAAGLGGGDKDTAMATAGDVITKKLVSEAVNIFGANVTTQQLLARSSGEILNPNMELLFSDVTIRNFRFNFKLTPRNPKEAQQVKLIIRAFKRNMAPQAQGGVQGAGNFFLRSPNVFKIRYRSGNKDHPFLNKFKQCFLTGVQTTYTGEGVYSTYDDRTPVSIILDLSFKEIQPIYDIDYDTRPGNRAVGY